MPQLTSARYLGDQPLGRLLGDDDVAIGADLSLLEPRGKSRAGGDRLPDLPGVARRATYLANLGITDDWTEAQQSRDCAK